MAEVFLKLLVWGLQHTKRVYRNIGIDIIDIEWYRGINNKNRLEAA